MTEGQCKQRETILKKNHQKEMLEIKRKIM